MTELTLFPTEKDLWTWDPLGKEGQFSQATLSTLKEMQLFEIDRLLKKEAKEAEKIVAEEISSIEPQYNEETQEFTGFNAWSQSTAKLTSFKINQVGKPNLG